MTLDTHIAECGHDVLGRGLVTGQVIYDRVHLHVVNRLEISAGDIDVVIIVIMVVSMIVITWKSVRFGLAEPLKLVYTRLAADSPTVRAATCVTRDT